MARKPGQPKHPRGTVKKYKENDILDLYSKKSPKYKVDLLEAALKNALLGQRESAAHYLAIEMGFEYAEGDHTEDTWVKKIK